MAGNSESIDGNDTVWPHNFHTSTAYVPHLEKVFSNVRQKFGRKPGDKMEYLDAHTSIWGTFLSAILQAAVHLGHDLQERLSTWNCHSVGDRRSVIVRRVPNVHCAPKVLSVSVKSVERKERKMKVYLCKKDSKGWDMTRGGQLFYKAQRCMQTTWATRVRVIVLCSSVCAVFEGVLFTHPVDWLEVFPRQPKLPLKKITIR